MGLLSLLLCVSALGYGFGVFGSGESTNARTVILLDSTNADYYDDSCSDDSECTWANSHCIYSAQDQSKVCQCRPGFVQDHITGACEREGLPLIEIT